MFLLSVICNNSTHHSVGNAKSFLIQIGYIHTSKKSVFQKGIQGLARR